MSITTSRTQPALFGGLVMGVLSALPIISVGNFCCCLWVVSGGVVAAYVLQQNEPGAMTPADGAQIGLLAGVVGALIYLVVSVPVTIIVAPMQRQVLERLIEAGDMPPEFREYATAYAGGILGVVLSFIATLVAGVIFSTLGGVIGAVVFRRPLPPRHVDVPTSA